MKIGKYKPLAFSLILLYAIAVSASEAQSGPPGICKLAHDDMIDAFHKAWACTKQFGGGQVGMERCQFYFELFHDAHEFYSKLDCT